MLCRPHPPSHQEAHQEPRATLRPGPAAHSPTTSFLLHPRSAREHLAARPELKQARSQPASSPLRPRSQVPATPLLEEVMDHPAANPAWSPRRYRSWVTGEVPEQVPEEVQEEV